jgi:hypothetical protein
VSGWVSTIDTPGICSQREQEQRVVHNSSGGVRPRLRSVSRRASDDSSSGHFGRVLDAPAALNVTPYVLARFVITPVLDQPTEVGAARWLDPDGYIGMPLCLPRRIVDNDARGAALPKPLPSARTPRLRKGNRSAVSPSPGLTSHTPPLHRFNRLGCSGSPRLRNRNRRGGSTGTAAGKPLASVGTGREKSPSHFPSSGTGAV